MANHGGQQNGNQPQNIFVKFLSWCDSENIKMAVVEVNRRYPGKNLNVSQMYSKKLTTRYNKALKRRIDLKKM